MYLKKLFSLLLLTKFIFSFEQYQPIQEILNQYQRPITVLEISPIKGFFSFRIAEEYDSTCVMIEGQNAEELNELCLLADFKNIILLKKDLTPRQIERLSDCEHFDIVIVNSLHDDFYKEVEQLLKLGDHLFIKIGNSNQELEDYLIENKGEIVFCDSSFKIFFFRRNKKRLRRTYWHRGISFARKYFVESSFENKFFIKKRKKYVWQKGINLTTFKVLGGIYPSYDIIRTMIKNFKGVDHGDLRLWNMILQGKNIILIDNNGKFNPQDCLEETLLVFAPGSEKDDKIPYATSPLKPFKRFSV
jgi:hypothetical protein